MNTRLPSKAELEKAYADAVSGYILARRQRIEPFVDEHFGFSGSARRHQKAMGWDLLRAPFNMFYSIPVLIAKLSGKALGMAGLKEVKNYTETIWPGFTTDVETESKRLIYEDLLELPWEGGDPANQKNALFEEILNQPQVSEWVDSALKEISERSNLEAYREGLEKNLQEFSTAQMSAADIASNLIILATAYSASKEVASGAYSAGTALAAVLAQQLAINSFWAGSFFGSIYYSWFPATAALGLTAVAIVSMAILLAVLSSFIGILTDPIQKFFKLHKKRLDQAIDDLERDLKGEGSQGYVTKSKFIARVGDAFEMFNAALK